ncbi:conserved exported hypothetical protein [uncultured Paludibacter sp.]|uniref:DUF4440 domain-containing protein n=1 Tax=uncultured Paludibacter sp. TaxID=497635 RepID=A0A653A5V2_9BACT|nr:conserved exported hypothetical protein [uncultured Paludibacter sp.]
MKKLIVSHFHLIVIAFFFSQSFAQNPKVSRDSIRTVIMTRERQFNIDLNKFGASYAFEKYADENAVINRGKDSLIYGKKAIEHYYSKPVYKKAYAEWKPDFIEVSDDGTFAYTYGKYSWEFIKENGEKVIYSGIFHTVWKRNDKGEWFYVWD